MTNNGAQGYRKEQERPRDGLSNFFRADLMGLEVERLAIAVSRSNARLLIGATSVLSTLLVGVSDLALGALGSNGLRDLFPDSFDTRFAGRPRTQAGPEAAQPAGVIDSASEVLTQTLCDSADAIMDAVRCFSGAYDEQLGRQWNSKPHQQLQRRARSSS